MTGIKIKNLRKEEIEVVNKSLFERDLEVQKQMQYKI